jgi:hypothetical protein
MLFLNSWRVSVVHYYVTTHPLAIQNQQWQSREAQIEPPLIECEWAFRLRAWLCHVHSRQAETFAWPGWKSNPRPFLVLLRGQVGPRKRCQNLKLLSNFDVDRPGQVAHWHCNSFSLFISASVHLILNFVLGGVALFMAVVIIILVCGLS